MKKIYLVGILVLGTLGVYAVSANKYLQGCINRCLQSRKICNDKNRLTMARVRACEAVDNDFNSSYNCVTPCQKNSRTARFDAVI